MQPSPYARIPRYIQVWRLARRWGLSPRSAAPDALAAIRAPVYLDVAQLAARWQVHPIAIFQRKQRGRLPPYVLVGTRMYFPREALERWEQTDAQRIGAMYGNRHGNKAVLSIAWDRQQ